jgi:tetraacyldisaccharide-1-P 4'-kinase
VDRLVSRARAAGAQLIVTTEKDAVKLERLIGEDVSIWSLRIATRIEPDAAWNAMLDRLAALVRA